MPANTLSTQAMTSTYSCQCYWMLVSKVNTENTKWKHQIHWLLWIRIRRKSQPFGIVVYFYHRFSFASRRIKRNGMSLPPGFFPLSAVIGTPWRQGNILPEMRFPACALSIHFKFIESFFFFPFRSHTTLLPVATHSCECGSHLLFLGLRFDFSDKMHNQCRKVVPTFAKLKYLFFFKKKTLSLFLSLYLSACSRLYQFETLFFNALWSMTLAKYKLTRSRDCAAVADSISSCNYKREYLFNPCKFRFGRRRCKYTRHHIKFKWNAMEWVLWRVEENGCNVMAAANAVPYNHHYCHYPAHAALSRRLRRSTGMRRLWIRFTHASCTYRNGLTNNRTLVCNRSWLMWCFVRRQSIVTEWFARKMMIFFLYPASEQPTLFLFIYLAWR